MPPLALSGDSGACLVGGIGRDAGPFGWHGDPIVTVGMADPLPIRVLGEEQSHDGTSQAAAMLAGVAACVQSAYRARSGSALPPQALCDLLAAHTELPGPGTPGSRLDIEALVRTLRRDRRGGSMNRKDAPSGHRGVGGTAGDGPEVSDGTTEITNGGSLIGLVARFTTFGVTVEYWALEDGKELGTDVTAAVKFTRKYAKCDFYEPAQGQPGSAQYDLRNLDASAAPKGFKQYVTARGISSPAYFRHVLL